MIVVFKPSNTHELMHRKVHVQCLAFGYLLKCVCWGVSMPYNVGIIMHVSRSILLWPGTSQFTHTLQGYITRTVLLIWLPPKQWSYTVGCVSIYQLQHRDSLRPCAITIIDVPVKIITTKQGKTQPCAYFMWCTVYANHAVYLKY